jgi:hypothetical protein
LIDICGNKQTLIPQSEGIYALPALRSGIYIVQSGDKIWKLMIKE